MTTVYIEYNPFKIDTIIEIDGNDLAGNGRFSRYRSTPMQTWLNASFLESLFDEQNDDEYAITFKGLRDNYRELECALQDFMRKNDNCDVRIVDFIECEDQYARMDKLTNTATEILNNPTYADSLSEDLSQAIRDAVKKDTLEILVMGGDINARQRLVDRILNGPVSRDDSQRGIQFVDMDINTIDSVEQMENALFHAIGIDIPFVDTKYCRVSIYEFPQIDTSENVYVKFCCDKINSQDKPIVIFLMQDSATSGEKKILDEIAKAWKERGMKNRWRFLFVADNASNVKKELSSRYMIHNAAVYDYTDIEGIIKRMLDYHREVCCVEGTKKRVEGLLKPIKNIVDNIGEIPNRNMGIQNIDELEKRINGLLEEIQINTQYIINSEGCSYIDDRVNTIFDTLGQKLYEKICSRKLNNNNYLNRISRAYGLPLKENGLPLKETDELLIEINQMMCEIFCEEYTKYHERVQILINDDLFIMLNRLDCMRETDILKRFVEYWNGGTYFEELKKKDGWQEYTKAGERQSWGPITKISDIKQVNVKILDEQIRYPSFSIETFVKSETRYVDEYCNKKSEEIPLRTIASKGTIDYPDKRPYMFLIILICLSIKEKERTIPNSFDKEKAIKLLKSMLKQHVGEILREFYYEICSPDFNNLVKKEWYEEIGKTTFDIKRAVSERANEIRNADKERPKAQYWQRIQHRITQCIEL